MSALVQGGYVRRRSLKSGSVPIARAGVRSCFGAIAILALLPALIGKVDRSKAIGVLYLSGLLLAFTSGTVVTSLTALASLETERNTQTRGAILGKFRARGQVNFTKIELMLQRNDKWYTVGKSSRTDSYHFNVLDCGSHGDVYICYTRDDHSFETNETTNYDHAL